MDKREFRIVATPETFVTMMAANKRQMDFLRQSLVGIESPEYLERRYAQIRALEAVNVQIQEQYNALIELLI